MGQLTELRDEALQIAIEHGFKDATVGEDLALMHSEVSEALEAYRDGWAPCALRLGPDGKPEGVPSELADVIIRVLHFSGKHSINIEDAVMAKMAYNKSRPFKHGGKKL
jgi:hypothetical protein